MVVSGMVEIALDIEFGRRWMVRLAEAIERDCAYLTRLDAAIGDADHGINMRRGMRAAVAGLEQAGPHPKTLFEQVGKALILTVGGAGGPLYGTAFRQLGKTLPDREAVAPRQLALGLTAALEGIQRLGAAEQGDKTMVDAFAPAVAALRQGLTGGWPIELGARAAADAAEAGMVATIPMRALKGRASYLGPRSEGHQDPGATSTALLFRSLADALGA
ncbi:MAG: dihydroxyacetone kinase subunit DhaL [Acidimicrobiia bacterium]